MRLFFDPSSLSTMIGSNAGQAGVSTGFKLFDVFSSFGQSNAAAGEMQANAALEGRLFERNAALETIATQRTLRDEGRETRLRLSRMRAVIAAAGADSSMLGLVSQAAGEAGRRAERIRFDSSARIETARNESDFRRTVMRSRASNTRRQGFTDLVLGGAKAGAEGLSLFRSLEDLDAAS